MPTPGNDPPPFEWSDHAGKLVIASPCFAASASIGIVSFSGMTGSPAPLGGFEIAVLLGNLLASVLGSTVAGLLIRGTLSEKIGAAIGASVVGLYGYVLAFLGIGGIVALFVGIVLGAKRLLADVGYGGL